MWDMDRQCLSSGRPSIIQTKSALGVWDMDTERLSPVQAEINGWSEVEPSHLTSGVEGDRSSSDESGSWDQSW